MPNSLHTLLIACALAALAPLAPLAGCASQPAHADAPRNDANDLSWLEGSWSAPAWGGTLYAEYVARDDGLVIGHSQLVINDEVAYHEFEVFGTDAAGAWVVTHPNGQPAPRFNLTSRDRHQAAFENPTKDFPTRIVYERVNDQLVITLSDPYAKSAEPQVFTFTPRNAPVH